MAFIQNSFFQESDVNTRASADDQMKEMSMRDIEKMVKVLEALPTDQSIMSLKNLHNLNGYNILDDYEYDPALQDESLKVIRRRMHALFRGRFREIMKLKREVKLREHAGHYTTRGKEQVLNTHFLPESLSKHVKRLAILCLFELYYIGIATMFTPTAAMNQMLNGITTHTSGLWLLYWVPTLIYLMSVPIAFHRNSRPMHIVSVSIAFGSFAWHIMTFVLSMSDDTRQHPTAY